MTRLLYDTETSALQPYPRADDEDVVGLDPRYLALWLTQEPQPDYDSTTHRLDSTEVIDLDAGTVTRGWQLVTIEPPPPAPDWPTFRAMALNSKQLDGVSVAAQQAAPTAALALGAALLAAEGNGCEPFAQAWARVVAAVPVPPQLIAGFQAQAQACNLPAAFVAALDPSTEQP